MSLFSQQTMTNDHAGMLSHIAETLHVWRERTHSRQELAHLTERELHDVGLSSADAAFEIEKHFWEV